MADDLSSLKDDMNAFILGHGLSRFQGYVTEDVHSVMWDPRDNPESWKDFVELAKKAGSEFLSMDEEVFSATSSITSSNACNTPIIPAMRTWKKRAGCATT